MLNVTLHNPLRLWTLILFLVFGMFVATQTSMAQSTDEDYKVTILAPHSTFLGQDQEIVVRVRTLQGGPAQGIPVRFQLDPEWHGDAKIVPEETTTQYGIARARVRADLIGHVGVTVRVGFGTVLKRTGLLFVPYSHGEPGGGA
ncbi:MAG: Ig-like domain-containing protein [Candidatus Tectomicrobia bacterium]|nr:Ig-like domain-containing protein [Candidatus Tectomicrobia bacterium]